MSEPFEKQKQPLQHLSIFFMLFMLVTLVISAYNFYAGELLKSIYLVLLSSFFLKLTDWFAFASRMAEN